MSELLSLHGVERAYGYEPCKRCVPSSPPWAPGGGWSGVIDFDSEEDLKRFEVDSEGASLTVSNSVLTIRCQPGGYADLYLKLDADTPFSRAAVCLKLGERYATLELLGAAAAVYQHVRTGFYSYSELVYPTQRRDVVGASLSTRLTYALTQYSGGWLVYVDASGEEGCVGSARLYTCSGVEVLRALRWMEDLPPGPQAKYIRLLADADRYGMLELHVDWVAWRLAG